MIPYKSTIPETTQKQTNTIPIQAFCIISGFAPGTT